jgi:hypothetical protein
MTILLKQQAQFLKNEEQIIFRLFHNLNAVSNSENTKKLTSTNSIEPQTAKANLDLVKVFEEKMQLFKNQVRTQSLYNKLFKIRKYVGLDQASKYLEGFLEDKNITLNEFSNI